MKDYPRYSHDGLNDQLTRCAAPPLFYSHLERMISGSKRAGTSLTLASITIPILSNVDDVLSIAHVINQMMRREDLCGRTGHFQFVIILFGNLNDGQKLLERIGKSTHVQFTSELVQWMTGETSLEILYRLDRAVELSI